ncbi:MAG: 2-isopropylmalate synthase [Verrucomicrobia bacterium]|nr:2-isopropylmalate synthase [Verrucomicrobiota bacterium]MDA1067132.1 2-isopropylmalate synthase [Verrucomicrobiota bacterium]
MQKAPITKYQPFKGVALPDRQWPEKTIDKAPIWCSVDLRDGNQALAIPMNIEEKLEMFNLLVSVGFKQIEVGFPSASDTEYNFLRRLIEDKLIPEDVTLQVLVQAREHLIRRTFEAIKGAPRVIVHLYNSTNPLQRRVTFGLSKEEIKDIAVTGTALVRELVGTVPETEVLFQYSPESFSDTEMEFALEVCEAVFATWNPAADESIILNLPATVELATPNIHADQIEWFCRNFSKRDQIIVSLHTHNDRGTGVAATELGLMAGADRVEGTLFGNGERTGNLDIVIVALNLYSQGIDSGLDFTNLTTIRNIYERCTRMDVHDRHPYSGDLVFTAFSGSHQDAIKKGMEQMDPADGALWQVPYLLIDPKDIGRDYEAIIRINSQSGKGGVSFVLENEFGYLIPKSMGPELGNLVSNLADKLSRELTPGEILESFLNEYTKQETPLNVKAFNEVARFAETREIELVADLSWNGQDKKIQGRGNGPINAFCNGLGANELKHFHLVSFSEHSIGLGSGTKAAAYVQIQKYNAGLFWGIGVDNDIELASLKALVSAINRSETS